MKLKQVLLMLPFALLFNIEGANAQINIEYSKPQPLKVGDKVPDYTLVNLINHPTQTAKLSDFQGKLLLLDFWSTGCASCILSWPKLEKLQEEFKGKIQIILVNPWQDQSIVKSLLKKRKNAGIVNLTLPIVCKDTMIVKFIPVKSVPHIVWIDESGHVKSITYGGDLNSKNIQAILNKRTTSMHQKTDTALNVDYTKPLFVNGNGGNNNQILGSSILSRYVDGLPYSFSLTSDKNLGYSIYITQSLDMLYGYAYSNRLDMNRINLFPITSNRLILEVKDLSQYVGTIDSEIQWQNLYVYQLILNRPATVEQLQKMMRADLDKYFSLKVRWERRKMKCLVLTATDTSLISYKRGKELLLIDDAVFQINKFSVSYVVEFMTDATNYYNSPYPIIDETGFKGELGDILIEKINVFDYKQLDRALEKYNMHLKLQERTIDVLVISDPNFSN